MGSTPSSILARLGRLRQIARRRLLLFGVFAVLAGGIAAFFTIVMADWLVSFPPLLRIIAGGLFAAGFVLATFHWVVSPLRASLTLQEVAAKMEESFPALKDRLSSSVNFLERGETKSSAMARHVVEETEIDVEHIPLEQALVGGPVKRRASALAAGLVLLAIMAAVHPDWLRVGAKRYLSPWEEVEWPSSVSIRSLTGDQVVALGDSANVQLQVIGGWSEDLRPLVHYREADGSTGTIALRNDGNAQYSATIEAVTNDLTYWFEAGDTSTEKHPATVRVVRRPEIIEAMALIERPPYAAEAPARLMDLRDARIHVAVGGLITVQLKASKKLDAADPGSLGLHGDDGSWYPLIVDSQDPTTLSCKFTVTKGLQLSPQIQDEHGFRNRASATYVVHALPDAPPSLVVLDPPPISEVTATATLRVVIRAEDDFGVESLRLVIDRPGGDQTDLPIEITAHATTSDSRVQVLGTHPWNIATLSPNAGDVISYKGVAQDNYPGDSGEGQESFSSEMRLKILTNEEFDMRIREALAALEEKLRRTAFDQTALNDETTALRAAARADAQLTDVQRRTLGGMSFAQLRIARQVRESASRLDDVARRVEQNDLGSAQLPHVIQLGEALRSVAAGSMAAASSALIQARERSEQENVQGALSDAVQFQQKAVHELRDVLRSMGQWGAFQGVVARTQDLFDRQNQIRRTIMELGKATLGKPLEALKADELGALRGAERAQEQLFEDVGEHLARLEQMRQTLADKDPSAAESLEGALRAARAEDVMRHVRDAVTAIASNRTGAAESEQRSAAQGLQKMLTQLREREKRELAQLRKELDDAATQVGQLMEQQQEVLAQTTASESPSESESETLAEAQGVVARNAKFLGDELIDEEVTSDAGRLVRLSATRMSKSEDELLAGDTTVSAESQREAIRLLTDARDSLLAASQKTSEELLRRTLAEIQQELQDILAAQQAINAVMTQLRDMLKTEGRLTRAGLRDSAKLAKDQRDVRIKVAGLLPDMEQAAVYRWALERVGKWMNENHDTIEAREYTDSAVAAAGRIAHELENLIAAIVETQSMPLDTEFTESGRGGGSPSEGATAPPLPSLTELLVLRTMQNDINARTAALYTRFDAQNPTEISLRELVTLGEDQLQVQKLAQMVTDRVRKR